MSAVDIVSELGHTVHEVLSAQNALAVLTTHTIDVLITDVGLPGMSGNKSGQAAPGSLANDPNRVCERGRQCKNLFRNCRCISAIKTLHYGRA